MTEAIDRRRFLKSGAALAGTALLPAGLAAAREVPARQAVAPPAPPAPVDASVDMTHDGLVFSPKEYAQLLLRIAETEQTGADYYSRGGAVEALESACARLLGKETAVFMPTGTLANQLAVRMLAGNDRRVIVQHESHLYNDTGDCAQTLSGLTLLPLGKGKATFTVDDVDEALGRTDSGRVAARVGVISIESPVRRRMGEQFAGDELQRVTSFARKEGIRLHLDGARMLLACAYTGIPPAQYAAPFDTVYLSLWKGLNAASGAILAGPKSLLENLFHTRRMFGGGLPQAWPFAAVALHFLDGFVDRFRAAVQSSEAFIRELAAKGITAQRVTLGTNIFSLPTDGVDAAKMVATLAASGITVSAPAPRERAVRLLVNESWSRRPAAELAADFVRALAKA
jgi:threonine aldolase